MQPWDEKGFKIPGGDPYHPAASQVFVAGNAMLHAKTMGNYPAPEAIMSAVYEGLLVPIDAALRIEARYMTKVMMHPASRNMIRSLFINMQKANKLERRPKDAPKTKLDKIGVLGAGMMGAGIAYVSALAGLNVVLIDRSLEDAEKGKGYSAKLLAKQVERGRMKQDAADAVLARITPATDYDGLKDADFVIEAVFEDRAIKADVTKKTAAVLPAGVPFASNTSTLPITGLAEAWRDETAFIGVHFFSPVDRMQLVEIIRGKKTVGRHAGRGDGLRAAHQEDADRRQRLPRLLHQPRVRHLHRRGHAHAGRGHQPGADRERRQDDRHADAAAGAERRGGARPDLQDRQADGQGHGRGLQAEPDRSDDREAGGAAGPPRQEGRQGLLRLSRRRQEAPVAGPCRAGAARGRAAVRWTS